MKKIIMGIALTVGILSAGVANAEYIFMHGGCYKLTYVSVSDDGTRIRVYQLAAMPFCLEKMDNDEKITIKENNKKIRTLKGN